MKCRMLLFVFLLFYFYGYTGGCCLDRKAERGFLERPRSVSILEFGAIGDGVTLNTHAFEAAITHIRTTLEASGGAVIRVPRGRWLTGPFNLTSHCTLFLEADAVILAAQDPALWPVIDALPTYGRGRELPGPRYTSLIHGEGITDVAIVGNNGTIDGQGAIWWDLFRSKKLKYTRGHLIEFLYSNNILIADVTFTNSPFWTIHPVYCSNIFVKRVTILAPHKAPNTDGIDPDSSFNVCIEDSYISNGDDAIAVKSGWDEYGLEYNRPSHDIFIRNLTISGSHGISLGSEMSGGIYNIDVRDIVISDAPQAIHIKTAAGRGAYIVNASFTNFQVFNTAVAIAFTSLYGDHPDSKYNPMAFSKVERIMISNMVGHKVPRAGEFRGSPQSPFTDVCLRNITLEVGKLSWNCSFVKGSSFGVFPQPCTQLTTKDGCDFVLPASKCF